MLAGYVDDINARPQILSFVMEIRCKTAQRGHNSEVEVAARASGLMAMMDMILN